MNSYENLNDIKLELSVNIGKETLSLKEVSEIGEGSIIVLNQDAGDPIVLNVNGIPKFLGDLILVENNYAIRVTDVYKNRL
jgi:flagellar motor switch protein FliN/FliY